MLRWFPIKRRYQKIDLKEIEIALETHCSVNQMADADDVTKYSKRYGLE